MDEKLLFNIVKILLISLVSLAAIIGTFIKIMHSQAMNKFDDLINEVKDMARTQAVHGEKLDVSYNEFDKIELHQKEQDVKIAQLDNRVVILENTKENN